MPSRSLPEFTSNVFKLLSRGKTQIRFRVCGGQDFVIITVDLPHTGVKSHN